MEGLLLLFLWFFIGSVNTENTYEENISQFLREQKLGELLNHEGGTDLDYEIISPILKDHNGNKRTRSVEESYPEEDFYTIEGLGHKFDLHLKKNNDVISNNFKVTTHDEDGTISNLESSNSHKCLYHGTATSHDGSEVAMSTCNGLIGLIQTNNGVFLVEKLPNHLRKKDADHIIYKKVSSESCGVKEDMIPYGEAMKTETRRLNKSINNKSVNKGKQLYVQSQIYGDYELYLNFKYRFGDKAANELRDYLLAVFNGMQLVYSQPSLNIPIKFILLQVVIFTGRNLGPAVTTDGYKYLDNFCVWQSSQNQPNPKTHWDAAWLFTRIEMQGIGGLAPSHSMCTARGSCTLSSMSNFNAVYIAAHEVGHTFGMRHDNDQNNCAKDGYIMSASKGSTTWSTCSGDYMRQFMNSDCSFCVFDYNTPGIPYEKPLPGEKYNIDQQCKLWQGPTAVHYSGQPLSEVCISTKCLKNGLVYWGFPALEGTVCGQGVWCRNGKCNRKNSFGKAEDLPPNTGIEPINGDWSEWIVILPCKSNCTLRLPCFEVSMRVCNNPRPQNGGHQCIGETIRIEKCEKVTQFSGLNDPKDIANNFCKARGHSGGQQFPQDLRRGCEIWCQTFEVFWCYEKTGHFFPDGTPCNDRPNWHCRRGMCYPNTAASHQRS